MLMSPSNIFGKNLKDNLKFAPSGGCAGKHFTIVIRGLCYGHITIINDASRAISK
jgi:hypothetical protein